MQKQEPRSSGIQLSLRLLTFATPHWKRIGIAVFCMLTLSLLVQGRLLAVKFLMDDVLGYEEGPAVQRSEGTKGDGVESGKRADMFDLLGLQGLADKLRAIGEAAISSVLPQDIAKKKALSQERQFQILMGIVVIAAILSVLIFLLNWGKMYFTEYVAARIMVGIRSEICGKLLTLSLKFFNDRRSGELISRLTNDIGITYKALRFLFGDLILQPMMFLAAVALAFIVSWQLTLVTFVLMPFLCISIRVFGKKIRRSGKASLEKLADVTDAMQQMFSGIRVVKAFKMENYETEEFYKTNRRYLRAFMKMVKARALSESILMFFTNFGVALVLFVGGYVVIFNTFDLSAGDLLTFLAMLAATYKPVKKLAKAYNVMQESLAGAERLFDLLDMESDIQDDPEAVELREVSREIAFKNVSFSYNHEPVLRDISFCVRPGEITAIVGQSGAGKSTLLDLVPRFYDPTEGSIEFDGTDLRRIKRETILDNVAMVTQQTFLFNTSIGENIRYGRKDASFEEIVAAANAANIHDFIETLPDKYDTVVGEQGVRLSGGERQRVTIARAILKNAPILILDEATSSLDSESERLVQEALNNLMKNRTTFVIAHRLSTVQHADKIFVLEKGKIIEAGSHRELLEKGGVYKRLYELQFIDEDRY